MYVLHPPETFTRYASLENQVQGNHWPFAEQSAAASPLQAEAARLTQQLAQRIQSLTMLSLSHGFYCHVGQVPS